MTTKISPTASKLFSAMYLIAAGFVMSWPLVAFAELVRLSQ
jgi:hypothetical protein